MNIRTRFLLLVTLSLAFSITAVSVYVISRERRLALESLEKQGYALADALALTFLADKLRGDEAIIGEIAREVAAGGCRGTSDAPLYLVVLASDGKILYESGTSALLDQDDDRILNHNALVMPTLHLTDFVRLKDGRIAIDLKSRMFVREIGGTVRRFGAVRLGLSLDVLEKQASDTYLGVLVLVILALLTGIGATYLTTRNLISDLAYLGGRIRSIAGGDLVPRTRLGGVLGELEADINRLAEDLQKREILKQYISSSTWEEIEKKVSLSQEGTIVRQVDEGSLRKVTILFMDIRNFTALAESSRSRDVVQLLNEIFGMMVDIIEAYGGVLDKFIGDALLTVFYPEDLDDDAIRAAYCAVEMQLRLEQFNQRRAFYGRDAVRAGIGINSGHVIAGSIGARTRKDYTVIGDPVNVAARLEKKSKYGRHTHIVISDETYRGLKGLVTVEPMEDDEIRGRQKPVPVYEIVSVKDVDQILSLLTSSDDDVRENAFKAVEARRDGKAVPVIVDLIDKGGEDLILRAIVVLGRLGRKDPRIGPVLEAITASATSERILATAIKASAFRCDQVDPAFFKPFLSHEDARVRANTIEALDLVAGSDCLEWIEPYIYDDNPRVKANAAVALWKRGRFDVGSILERLSYGTVSSERACAVFAAGELFRLACCETGGGRQGSVPGRDVGATIARELRHYRKLSGIIRRLLDDPDETVRRQAVKAAGKSGDPGLVEALISTFERSGGEERREVLETILKLGLPGPLARTVERSLGNLD